MMKQIQVQEKNNLTLTNSKLHPEFILKKVHSIVEMISYTCKDKNQKIIKVEFDASTKLENDVWCLAKVVMQNQSLQSIEFMKNI